jgi:hypothetical protein
MVSGIFLSVPLCGSCRGYWSRNQNIASGIYSTYIHGIYSTYVHGITWPISGKHYKVNVWRLL